MSGGTGGRTAVCRGCGGDARRVLDLGPRPASDSFPLAGAADPDECRPLELWFCPACALVQLGDVGALPEEPVLAVESATSRAHAHRAVRTLLAEYPDLRGGSVREFASHHGGSWIPALAEQGCPPVDGNGSARLVVDVHGLVHERDLRAALAARVECLGDGLLVVEFHHLLPLVRHGQFDTIRHGHWSYLSLTAVSRLAREFDLVVVRAAAEQVFGGSLRAVLAPRSAGRTVDDSVARTLLAEAEAGLDSGTGLADLAVRTQDFATRLRGFLAEQAAAGRTVLGYGAPSKAAVLLGVSGVGPELLPFTVDAAPGKHGRVIPGVRVPIRPVADLVAARPATVLLLTWDIAQEVVAALEADGGWGARYVLPLGPETFVPAADPLEIEVVR